MDSDKYVSMFKKKSEIPKSIKESILRIKFSLYLTLFTKALLPTIYSSVRVSLLGDLPSDAGVNIASQVVWLSLFFEVFQEMLIMPLCYTFGNTIDDLQVTSNKIKTGSLIIISVFSIILSSNASPRRRKWRQLPRGLVTCLSRTIVGERFIA